MLQRFYIGSAKGNKETKKKMKITVVLAATNKLSAVVVF